MANHNHQKKIAAINDISGFGRCSIAVSQPIISYLGIQCCPVPTSIFSNHTGFPEFFFDDYTDKMQEYIDNWKKLDLHFSGIMTGFLGSKKQIDIVKKFIHDFKDPETKVLIDPAMGENGKAYPTYTEEMCLEMKKLIEHADIITPNVTEACILTDTQYRDRFSEKELYCMAEQLVSAGAGHVVISGVDMGYDIGNVIASHELKPKMICHKKTGDFRSGTGDVYASIIAADMVNGINFEDSVRKAGDFVKEAITATERLEIPKTDGLAFEEVLYKLKRR
ncbi:MAG: pyridoxamine kinase [Lachnospiraceae bacterium]|nr:pyridoxamine kinase [Lachnospiraceae bacterium]